MLSTAEMDYTKVYPAYERRGAGMGRLRGGDQSREEEELRATLGRARIDP